MLHLTTKETELTPLLTAVRFASLDKALEVCCYLLSRGADSRARDGTGRTSLKLAQRRDDGDTTELQRVLAQDYEMLYTLLSIKISRISANAPIRTLPKELLLLLVRTGGWFKGTKVHGLPTI